jgi:hypothetical protein
LSVGATIGSDELVSPPEQLATLAAINSAAAIVGVNPDRLMCFLRQWKNLNGEVCHASMPTSVTHDA